MPRTSIPLIRAVAHRVRLWAEGYAKENGHPTDLGGLCAIASGKLHFELTQHRVKAVIYEVEGWEVCSSHCFVVAEAFGKFIVDVTASQFGLAPIVIAPYLSQPPLGRRWYHGAPRQIHENHLSLRRAQIRAWPMDQVALIDY